MDQINSSIIRQLAAILLLALSGLQGAYSFADELDPFVESTIRHLESIEDATRPPVAPCPNELKVPIVRTMRLPEKPFEAELRDDGYTIRFTQYGNRQKIALSGILNASRFTLSRLDEIFKKINPNQELLLDLSDYRGGDISSSEIFLEHVQKYCGNNEAGMHPESKCGITTYVSGGSVCASSCIVPFMAGKKRLACSTALFGFHSQSLNFGLFSIRRSPEESTNRLKALGVDPKWVDNHAGMFESTGVTWLSYRDLANSQILTDLDLKCDYWKKLDF